MFSCKCKSEARLDEKTAVITGCNTGIGKETVKDFYKRGARVVMACRNLSKAEAAKADIIEECKELEGLGSVVTTELDLNSLASVRECAKRLLESESQINLLINNAGIMMCPKGKTEDGFETQIGTNHFAHFLFTLLLLPKIICSKPARIVNVSSKAHEYGSINLDDINFEKRSYSSVVAYNQSKLANVLFTTELAKRLQENNISGVNLYSLHPGVIETELGRHLDTSFFPGASLFFKLPRIFIKSPLQGAQTTIYCAVDEKCAEETGLYYSECAPKTPSRNARNPETAAKFWDMSWRLVGLDSTYNPFDTQKTS